MLGLMDAQSTKFELISDGRGLLPSPPALSRGPETASSLLRRWGGGLFPTQFGLAESPLTESRSLQ